MLSFLYIFWIKGCRLLRCGLPQSSVRIWNQKKGTQVMKEKNNRLRETKIFTLENWQHKTNAQDFASNNQVEPRQDSKKETGNHGESQYIHCISAPNHLYAGLQRYWGDQCRSADNASLLSINLKVCIKAWNHDLWNHRSCKRDVAQAIPVKHNIRK